MHLYGCDVTHLRQTIKGRIEIKAEGLSKKCVCKCVRVCVYVEWVSVCMYVYLCLCVVKNTYVKIM